MLTGIDDINQLPFGEVCDVNQIDDVATQLPLKGQTKLFCGLLRPVDIFHKRYFTPLLQINITGSIYGSMFHFLPVWCSDLTTWNVRFPAAAKFCVYENLQKMLTKENNNKYVKLKQLGNK